MSNPTEKQNVGERDELSVETETRIGANADQPSRSPASLTSNQHCSCHCSQCGMLLRKPNDYHPYAACLMFNACRDGNVVEANLGAVVEYGAQQAQRQPDETSRQWQGIEKLALQRNAALGVLDKVRELLAWLPITTEELVRLRNANKITFDKQVNAITTCLIQIRQVLADSPEETTASPPP